MRGEREIRTPGKSYYPCCGLAIRRLRPLGQLSTVLRTSLLPVLRTRRGIRTPILRTLNAAPLPVGLPGLDRNVRALGAIRTRTVQILGLVPLPLGHEGGESCGRRTRTSNLRVQSAACCRLHQPAKKWLPGFEPGTSAMARRRSTELSYSHNASPERFELPTPGSVIRCSIR